MFTVIPAPLTENPFYGYPWKRLSATPVSGWMAHSHGAVFHSTFGVSDGIILFIVLTRGYRENTSEVR
jgi:hypothetical protein